MSSINDKAIVSQRAIAFDLEIHSRVKAFKIAWDYKTKKFFV